MPDALIAGAVGMAGRTRHPAPGAHRWLRGAEENLAAHPLRRLRRLAHLHLAKTFHRVRVVDADLEIECRVDVHRFAVRTDAHGPRILADRNRAADALDLLVIV